jgi:succinate dehydrogenase / fumarate reductase cytochrome b subunit
MLGNLQAFQGEEAIDAYGKLLRKEPALLWTARLGLLGAVGLHIWSYFALMKKNQKARPVAYQGRKYREASLASLSMTVTGPLLLLFIVYHILHMTVGVVHPSFEEGAVYHNLVTGLTGVVGLIYVAAMVMLALHLWHGVWSLFQTLGVSEARFDSVGRTFATVFTLVVTIGFALIPLAVMAGVFRLP